MKITIKRYFERTRQIADFIPVKAACEASVEVDDVADATNTQEEALLKKVFENYSKGLDTFVQAEVEKTLMGYTPACIACGGKAIYPEKVLNKEGRCAQCQSDLEMKLRDLKKESGGPKPKVDEKLYD